MYQLLDGKLVSAKVKDEVKLEVEKLKKDGREITLAVILVGDDPASRVYVNNKKKACEYVGFRSFEYALDKNTSEAELLSLIEELNYDKEINGILCQLPLPEHIDEKKVIKAIDIHKDVDAFCEENVGKIRCHGASSLLRYFR